LTWVNSREVCDAVEVDGVDEFVTSRST